MTSVRGTRLACYFCNEYLVGRRKDDTVRNCFGFSYGPTENPFLATKVPKKCWKAPTDPPALQPVLLKCGHIFHKGCLKQSLQRENGSLNRSGNCPICKKTFILGKTIDIHLKVAESAKVSQKRFQEFEANEEERLSVRAEIERLQRLTALYQKGFTKARQSIVSDAHCILQHIRQMRRRKRLLDQFQRLRLDPLEQALDDVYDENNLWKQLLGQPAKVDSDGFYVATPRAPCPSCISCTATEDELPFSPIPVQAKPLTPPPLEFVQRVTSPPGPGGDPRPRRPEPEHDYSRFWELLGSPPSSAQKHRPNAASSLELLEPSKPAADSEPDYDIARFAGKVRASIEKRQKAKAERRLAREAERAEGKALDHNASGRYTPLSEEHWKESESDIGSDYRLEAASVVGSAELGKRSDVHRLLDPERAFHKWRQMLGTTLKFDYKYENGLINWEEDFPHLMDMARDRERFMLGFIDQKWKDP